VVTIIGGFAAVAYTDSIQTLIMVIGSGAGFIIGLVVAFVYLLSHGGVF
jgi:Na+/pantothenate symporter